MTHGTGRCPRCSGPLGERPARSRLTLVRDIPICPLCALSEALADAAGIPPLPPGEWPVHAERGR